MASMPDFSLEHEANADGYAVVCGVDEAGRGPLAGPVVAAAVIFPKGYFIKGLRDSKKLSPSKRDFMYDAIVESGASYAVGIVEPDEIDMINILNATLLAMKKAVTSLDRTPDYIIVDGINEVPIDIPQMPITGGDDKSISIAAASVIAKVTRDRMMCDFEKIYPQFSFSRHKGYGTKFHYEELSIHGPTPIHRKTFLKNTPR